MVVNINFLSINVNSQNINTSVSIGQSAQDAWSAHQKYNSNSGFAYGWTNANNMKNFISDIDGIDAVISDQKGIMSNQNQNF